MTSALVTLAPWLWLTMGCTSGDNDTGNDGVPMGTDEPTPTVASGDSGTDPIDPGPVTASIDPPDGYIDVAPLPQATITYSRPVTQLALDEATLAVTDRIGRLLPATLEVGMDSTTVNLVLTRPFEFDDTVTVSISGVQTNDGTAAPDVDATWEIHNEPQPMQVVNVNIDRGRVFTRNARDVQLGVDEYTTGPDGMFPSADDTQVSRRVDTLFPNDRLDIAEIYEDAGDDGMFGTGDDGLTRVRDIDVNGMQEELTVAEVGDDGVYGTGDDVVTLRVQTDYDANFNVTREIRSGGPGLDGAWFTADDFALFFSVRDLDTDGQITEARFYNDAGPDQVVFSADDVVAGYESRTYNGDKRLTAIENFFGDGGDDIWFTDDDELLQHERRNYNSIGQLSQRFLLTDEGPDFDWQTPDDLGTFFKFAFSGTGIETRRTTHSSYGDDGLWNNQDDVIARYTNLEFENTGLWTSYTIHDGPGVGNIWFDDDDNLVESGTYSMGREASDPTMPASLRRTARSARQAHHMAVELTHPAYRTQLRREQR